MAPEKKEFKHEFCDRVAKDAWALARDQASCKKCKAAIRQRAVAQPATNQASEIKMLREEVDKLKAELKLIKATLKLDTSCKKPCKTRYEEKDKSSYSHALQRPKPTKISVMGNGDRLRSGTYIQYDKNMYVLSEEAEKQKKTHGFINECILGLGYITFTHNQDEDMWQAELKMERYGKSYGRELPDKRWEFWSEDSNAWKLAHPTVSARY